MSEVGPFDRDEAALDRLLSAVPPMAPPVGFRDGVMRRVRGESWSPVEIALAVALSLPSLAFLVWGVASGTLDIGTAMGDLMQLTAAASGGQAFFVADGAVILAFASLGLGALLGSHALIGRR